MRNLIRLYDLLLHGMALVAAATLVWLMVSVVASVVMRNAGVQPFAWRFTSAEYGLLYMTMLGAPWLVREKNIERNDYDVRAYFIPRWMLTITFPIAFSVMAIEFSRFVFGQELMHMGEAGIHE